MSRTLEKSKELCEDLWWIIVDLHMQGMFHGDISKQLHIPESSIQTIINRYKLFGYVSTAKNKKNTQTVPLT